MKQYIENILRIAVRNLQEAGELPAIPAFIQIETTKLKQHGDFASNVALILAKPAERSPQEIAGRIIQALPESPYIEKVEIAGPGFINFFLSTSAMHGVISDILREKENYARSKMGRMKKVLVEFVSSNPAGPLHVGHGRHAAFGDVVANLFDLLGFDVAREYYVNDAGRQIDIMVVSLWLRYLAICGESIHFPLNGYPGEYIITMAQSIHVMHQEHFYMPAVDVFADLPSDAPEGDEDVYIDALIERAKQLLGPKYNVISDLAVENILADIREDLTEFGVKYDNWFSEREFIASGMVDILLDKFKQNGHVYEKDNALWFRSTEFGDDKDRVLVRSNGKRTYFANDLAYHLSKFERGVDIAIDIFGADHHGYVTRMKAAIEASGINPERLVHLIVQFVTLYRGDQQAHMSMRHGNYVTLRELREEVGNDAARFFYIMRKFEQHMDFDLDLATAQSNENPVYYIQYAYARICRVLNQLNDKQWTFDEANGLANLNRLQMPQEREIMNTLSRYTDIIIKAALAYEPHILANYLRDLAADLHAYYDAHQFLVDDSELRNARLVLIMAARQIFLNSFNLIGITARESM